MKLLERAVTVKQVPEALNRRQERMFLRDVENCLNAHRPRMVLDCSNVRELDRIAVRILLCCLEEAMKRNGDVKLAGLPPRARAVLEQTGLKRLFAIFDTTADAVDSFDRLPAVPWTASSMRCERKPETAA